MHTRAHARGAVQLQAAYGHEPRSQPGSRQVGSHEAAGRGLMGIRDGPKEHRTAFPTPAFRSRPRPSG